MKKLYVKEIFASIVILSACIITGNAVFAQGQFINNGAKITINSGTSLIVGDNSTGNVDFVNESGGSVANNGSMYVNGDWENNDAGGVFSGTGTVNLNGTSAQNIQGSDKTNFYNLVLTNAAKTMQVDA